MAILIADKPDVVVTLADLHRFLRTYELKYKNYAKEPPSLEEYIRREQWKEAEPDPVEFEQEEEASSCT